jgi:hypothetical protein
MIYSLILPVAFTMTATSQVETVSTPRETNIALATTGLVPDQAVPAPDPGALLRTRIRQALEYGDTRQAREVHAEANRVGLAHHVAQFDRMLAVPQVRPIASPHGRGALDVAGWMQRHGSMYRGKWVALRGGGVVGSAVTLQSLKTLLADDLEGLLFLRVD